MIQPTRGRAGKANPDRGGLRASIPRARGDLCDPLQQEVLRSDVLRGGGHQARRPLL